MSHLAHVSHNPHKTTNANPPPIGGGGPSSDRPIFRLGTDTKIYDDDLTGYASAHQMWLDKDLAGIRITQTDFGEDVSGILLSSPGRDGVTGKLLNFVYAGGIFDESHECWIRNLPTLPDPTTLVWTYWAKVVLGSPLPLTGSAGEWPIKFFMFFHRDGGPDAGLRIQHNTHDYLPGPAVGAPRASMWEVFDIAATSNQAHQPVGPFASDFINASAWSRFTHLYKPNTAPGTRDGVSRMWVDDTKVLDICLAQVGVTPPGGWKSWCELDDVDGLGSTTVNFPKFPGNLTTTTSGPFNFYWTEFSYWTRPAP